MAVSPSRGEPLEPENSTLAIFETKTIENDQGDCFELRSPQLSDAGSLIAFVATILEDGAGMTALPGEIPQELEWQKKSIREFNENPRAVQITVFHDGNIVAHLNFRPGTRKRLQHVGEFGISVAPAWRGRGIGKILLGELLNWAKTAPVEKIELRTRADNEAGHHLYKKLGFVEQGRLPKAIKLEDGSYVDDIFMYQFV